MGLCLGISAASLLEILYWFGYRIWFGAKKQTKVGDDDRL